MLQGFLARLAVLTIGAIALSGLPGCEDSPSPHPFPDASGPSVAPDSAAEAIAVDTALTTPAPDADLPSDARIPGDALVQAGDTDPEDFWTLVVIPDTQSAYYFSPSFFEAETRWIAQNLQREKIAFVLHEGDIVDNNQDRNQWAAARSIMGLIDNQVPYVLSVGNHDVETINEPLRSTNANEYFPFSALSARPGFGGAFEDGHLENTYHLLKGGDRTWLVLSLEFSPRQAVLDWADSVLVAHAQLPAMLLTHAYLYSDGQRYAHVGRTCQFYGACSEAPTTSNPQCWDPTCYFADGADGEMIWERLGAKNGNLLFVFSGHVATPAPNDAARLTTVRSDGTACHQLMADYQSDFATGGDGYLRLLRFYPDGRVAVRTFSPYVDPSRAFLTEDRNQFELRVRLP